MFICVRPGGGSESAAFTQPNTRSHVLFVFLGVYACRGSGAGCEGQG